MAVCSGGAGLAPEERAEVLAVLTRDPDEGIRERAGHALITIPQETFLAAAARADAPLHLFSYCAEELGERPGMADALAGNPKCPATVLATVAGQLSTGAVQALLENLERLSDTPALVEALVDSPAITIEQRAALEEMLKQGGEIDLTDALKAMAEVEPDPGKRKTVLQRLAKMRVVERMKLALTGGQGERLALIRDPNKVVQRAVLQSPKITDREVEGFSAMASLSDEILRLIAANRNFIKNYMVVKSLMNNSKTPLDVSLHLLPRLNPSDLKTLTMNKNVPETLRTMAMKLQRQRAAAKSKGGGA